ncbi:GTPase HflX [Propioniciclava sinopodophylli]|uniref:GTPase HflX n=1 Tax=Propioniciclava sinopodophylli TaxID=1837344 RepID=UPI002491CD21|nr:GTPase HflX [Propioniciclava sinopodophylli]
MAQPHSFAEQTPREGVLDRRAGALDDSAIDLHGHEWGTWGGRDEGPAGDVEHQTNHETNHDGDQLDREERAALRRVEGLSTELEDVTEVEYRQLRLERVVLASVWEDNGQDTLEDAENSLRELAALAETAGSTVLDGVIQRRLKPDAATYLWSGKAAELREIVAAEGADTVIVDGELGPSQRRALEDVVKVKVIDRTALILDIFAQHAKSREGRAQVELAQLQYLLPRLRGWGESMSRQAGGRVAGGEGIGSRGPGETKIELDRRRINTRISRLRRDLKNMKTVRDTKRSSRRAQHVPSVAIVGYTNAGKSSILNRLTGAGVLVENQLFATLDPTVRRHESEDGRAYTLSDTVGFVRNLPHQLVEAFRSTLEEAADADVLLHVVDGSHEDPEGQIAAVHAVLDEVFVEEETSSVPEIIAVNKADLAQPETLDRLRAAYPRVVVVSARTGAGIPELLAAVEEVLPRPEILVDVLLPYDRGDLVARLHDEGQVLEEEHTGEGTRLQAKVHPDLHGQLGTFAV